jgi:hypothetical protein
MSGPIKSAQLKGEATSKHLLAQLERHQRISRGLVRYRWHRVHHPSHRLDME